MSGFAPVKLSFGGAKLPAKKPIAGTSAFGSSSSSSSKKAATPSQSVFGAGDDEDEPVAQPAPQPFSANGRAKVSTATLSRAQKAKQAEEIALDSSVYEYDEVYDNMKDGLRTAEQAKKQDNKDRKPKYMSQLMSTAELRKRDRERAEDNTAQREREREGDMYADKEQFVTSAFKAQQEERRRKDEEDKRKEEEAKKKGGKPTFLRDMLEADDKVHAAAVAATLSSAPKPILGPTFNVAPPPKEKTDAELAAEVAAETGRRVELNEDGEIIDKRQLMQGGLNIARPRAGPNGPSSTGGGGFSERIADRKPSEHEQDPSSVRHLTSADGLSERERERQRRERHSAMIERQMLEQQDRRKREAEQEFEQSVQKVAKRTGEDRKAELIRQAKERREKKEEEARTAREAAQ